MPKPNSTKPPRMTAKQLKDIRDALGLHQAEFAAKLGVGLRTYIRYEKGQRSVPLVVGVAARCLRDK